jgi:hypothetical protein
MVGQERRRGPTPLSPHWLIERAPRTGPLDVTDSNRAYDVFVRDLATGGDEVVGVRGEGDVAPGSQTALPPPDPGV